VADRETVKDRAQKAAEQRKSLAEGGLPAGTTASELELAGNGAAVKADALRDLLERFEPEIAKQAPTQMRLNIKAFTRMVLTGMRTSKQAAALARCDRPSLFAALLEAARFGLTPFTDEAAIVPYGTTATFIPMAQGFVRMFWNTNQVRGVVVDFIRTNEVRGRDWEVSRGSGGDGFWHKPRFIDEETFEPVPPGEPMLAYCYLKFADGTCSEPAIITRWDAEDVMRNRSRAWQNAEDLFKRTDGRRGRDSLWHTDFNAMWLKTAVRRAAKYGPKSAELQELLMIEAREDRTRADATRPPAPPVGEGAGIDWTADIAGGKVVQSEVVREDDDGQPPFPGGALAPETVNLPGDAAGPAGEPASPPDTGQGQPEGESGEKITKSTAGKVNIAFSRIGWAGDARRAERMTMMGIIAAPRGAPLEIDSTNRLTEAQGQAFLHNWGLLVKAAAERGEELGEVVQRMYDATPAAAARKTQAGEQEPAGGQAPQEPGDG
jgi:recombination protein RecT